MAMKPDRSKSNLQYMEEHGFASEVLNGLLSLDLATQCDGFVASVYSNWARLIDELRSTIRCKAHKTYMDVEFRLSHNLFYEW